MADQIEWELRGSNGTVIKVTGVEMHREVVEHTEIADCMTGEWVCREYRGPIRISAIIAGTEAHDPQDMG